jgi:hypothetical protein
MKTLLTAGLLAISLLAGQAHAANASCEAMAAEKKLASATKTSFVKKCESDGGAHAAAAKSPTAACEGHADEKKLAGAARTSYVKKCVTDAGGKP